MGEGKTYSVESVQFSSVARSCPTLCDPMSCSTPGLPVHYQLLEFTQTHVHRIIDTIQPTHPLSSPFLLPPIPHSIRVFSNESTLRIRWPKCWSFSFTSSPFNEYSGLISLGLTALISLLSRDSQESSLVLQFESVNSSALKLLFGPTLTSVHDCWKRHSFRSLDLS